RSTQHHFRTTIVPAALLITVGLVMVVGALVTSTDSGQLGGDFPAFFAAGDIVAESGYDDLYDPTVQQEAQDGLIENKGGYLFFAYPPFVATGYSVIAPLGYRTAYVVQMLLMAAAAFGVVWVLRPMSEFIRNYWIAVLAGVVLFQPVIASLIGGQNTLLTMFLFVAAARGEWSGKDLLAGVAVGLLAYKPQYGLPLLLLVLIGGRWRVAAGAAATWAALYAAAAAVLGLGWLGPWWEQATAFRDINAGVNGHLFVSLPGFMEHTTGMSADAGRVLGLIIGVAGMLGLGWCWRRVPDDPLIRYAVAATGLILIAPQSLFYEAGVAAAAILLLVARGRVDRQLMTGVFAAGWVYAATAPLINTTLLVLALVAVLLRALADSVADPASLGQPAGATQ
ncbi:MAG: DUF2029 domain-containing protein, partial [Acidimicrobiia bacterium]|nr:DUF2029 domain-containing protein [Acidimicrobiia bacterium]